VRLIRTILNSLTFSESFLTLGRFHCADTQLPKIKGDINASLDHKAAVCVKFINVSMAQKLSG